MSTPNRFAVRDAGDFTFYNIATGKAIVTLDTIKTANMDFTGESSYARGGEGNPKLVGFSSNREGKLALQDALFDNNAIAMLTGNGLVSGAQDIDYKESKTVTSGKITLSKTPKGAIVSVYAINNDGTNGTEYTLGTPATKPLEYSVTGKELTFNTAVTNGTIIRVYYTVTTASDAKKMKVSSDSFGGTFKIVGNVLVRDSFDGKDYPATITIPRGKFEDNFSMALSVDGDPAVLDLPVEMLKDPVSKELWSMVVYNDADIL